MGQSILIAGCGDLGNELGRKLLEAGHRVFGLRRNIAQLSDSIHPIAYDLMQNSAVPVLPEVDFFVYAAAAKSREIERYKQIYINAPVALIRHLPVKPKRIFLVSSTGVFAQNQHEWINEDSPTQPNNPFGAALLRGEQQLAQLDIPISITRCSGIYGPGRTHLLDRVRQGIVAPEQPLHFSNRIHRDDAARFVAHLISQAIEQKSLEDLYLLADNKPSPIREVTLWLSEQLGVKPTKEEPIARGGSKKIDNARMLATGFELEYPSFKEGFKSILD